MKRWLDGSEIKVRVNWTETDGSGRLDNCPLGRTCVVSCMSCGFFGGYRNGTVDGPMMNTPIETKGIRRRMAEQVLCDRKEEE